MEVPEEVMQQLADIQSALGDVEEHLQPFLEAGPKEITAQLTPLERLKAHLALAQAAVTLFTLDRQLDAAKLDKHPLQKELERLAKYERKVQDAVTADDLARTRPGTSLNIAAANRFIDAAIPDLTQEQKAALRGVHNSSKRPAGAAAAAAEAAQGMGRNGAEGAEGVGPKTGADPGQQHGSRSSGRQSKRQRQQVGSKEQQQGAASTQEFIQELVAEVAKAEEAQTHQQEQQQQQQEPTGGAEGVCEPPGGDVDAGAFLQDIMEALDKQG